MCGSGSGRGRGWGVGLLGKGGGGREGVVRRVQRLFLGARLVNFAGMVGLGGMRWGMRCYEMR